MLKYFIAFILGAGLTACSSYKITTDAEVLPVHDQQVAANSVDSLITPYRRSLESEMLEVIAVAEKDFVKGRPSGSLNNWATDAVLVSQTRNVKLSSPVMCLLNVGGLRNTINAGDVTLGDMFKVMPFDNEVVWAEMPVGVLDEMADYLTKRGGEPIGNAKLRNGKLEVNGMSETTKTVWVITSDYLFNGGDHMDFFEKHVSVNRTGVLLRDVMIEEAKTQKTLIWNDENRIDIR